MSLASSLQSYTPDLVARVNSSREAAAEEGAPSSSFALVLPTSGFRRGEQPMVSPEAARDKLLSYHPYLARIKDWSNLVVAGGSVARSLVPYGYRFCDTAVDTDLYVHGVRDEAHLQSIVRRLIGELRPAWMLRSRSLITMSIETSDKEMEEDSDGDLPYHHCRYRTCQLILLRADTVAGVLQTFDVDECCVAFNGAEILMHPRAVEAFATRTSRVRPELASRTLFSRLAKYGEFADHKIMVPFVAPEVGAAAKEEAAAYVTPKEEAERAENERAGMGRNHYRCIAFYTPLLAFGNTRLMMRLYGGNQTLVVYYPTKEEQERQAAGNGSGTNSIIIAPTSPAAPASRVRVPNWRKEYEQVRARNMKAVLETSTPASAGNYAAFMAPGFVLEGMLTDPASVSIALVHLVHWAERQQQTSGQRKVTFYWDVETRLGKQIDDTLRHPAESMPAYPIRRQRQLAVFEACFPDDMMVAVIRRNETAFASAFDRFASDLSYMRETFWEEPLSLGTREELFGKVGCSAEEMIDRSTTRIAKRM